MWKKLSIITMMMYPLHSPIQSNKNLINFRYRYVPVRLEWRKLTLELQFRRPIFTLLDRKWFVLVYDTIGGPI